MKFRHTMALVAATGLMATLGCASGSQVDAGQQGTPAASSASASATNSSTPSATPTALTARSRFVAPAGAPDWRDEFSGRRLRAQWSHQEQGYQAVSSRRCSKVDPRAVRVARGVARISVIDDPDRRNGVRRCRVSGRSYDWRLNGHITTQKSHSFKYGTFAARVKFQPRRGQHASFWLWPTSPAAAEGSPKRTGAEIDIIEWFGNNHPDGGLTSFVYFYPNDGRVGVTPKKVGGFIKPSSRFGGRWAERFHVFSVRWTPRKYVFRIDGKISFRTARGVSGKAEYVNLSMLASDYELKFLKNYRDLPQTMSVDWVRHWKL